MGAITQLVKDFGGPTAFGRAIGVKPSTASEMQRRESIPDEHRPALVEAARTIGRDDVTYEWLVKVHASRTAKRRRAARAVSVASRVSTKQQPEKRP